MKWVIHGYMQNTNLMTTNFRKNHETINNLKNQDLDKSELNTIKALNNLNTTPIAIC